jgi:hypothetical protein
VAVAVAVASYDDDAVNAYDDDNDEVSRVRCDGCSA